LFAAAGVFCAIVSHPADTIVSKLNQQKGSTISSVAKKLGFAGKMSSAFYICFMFIHLIDTSLLPLCETAADMDHNHV